MKGLPYREPEAQGHAFERRAHLVRDHPAPRRKRSTIRRSSLQCRTASPYLRSPVDNIGVLRTRAPAVPPVRQQQAQRHNAKNKTTKVRFPNPLLVCRPTALSRVRKPRLSLTCDGPIASYVLQSTVSASHRQPCHGSRRANQRKAQSGRPGFGAGHPKQSALRSD